MKRRPRFYGNNIHIFLWKFTAKCIQWVSCNGGISLKSLPFKCCNHSKQINEAAFTLSLVCSQRQSHKACPCYWVLGQLFLTPICCPAPHRKTAFVAGKYANFTLTLP